jgi:hypothetical protein
MSTPTTSTAVEFHRVQELRRAAIEDFLSSIANLLDNVDMETEREWTLSAVMRRHGFGDQKEWSELGADDPRWTLACRALTLEAQGYGDQQRRLDIVNSLGKIGRALDQMDELVLEQQTTDGATKEEIRDAQREVGRVRREMRSAVTEFATAFDAWSRSERRS